MACAILLISYWVIRTGPWMVGDLLQISSFAAGSLLESLAGFRPLHIGQQLTTFHLTEKFPSSRMAMSLMCGTVERAI